MEIGALYAHAYLVSLHCALLCFADIVLLLFEGFWYCSAKTSITIKNIIIT